VYGSITSRRTIDGKALGPALLAGLAVNQCQAQAHVVVVAPDRAAHHISDVEFPRDLTRVHLPALVGESRFARDDDHTPRPFTPAWID
jgi:hypothetical protein